MYHGDYQYYLDKSAATSAREALTAGRTDEKKASVVPPQNRKRLEAEARQARSRQQKRVAELEKRVAGLEKKQIELTAILENPEMYKDAGKAVAVNRELMDVVEDIERATAEWEEAASVLMNR